MIAPPLPAATMHRPASRVLRKHPEIGAHHAVPALLGQLEQRRPGLDPGIVDEHVGGFAEPGRGLVHQPRHGLGIADIGGKAAQPAIACLFGDHRLGRGIVAKMREGDIIARRQEGS